MPLKIDLMTCVTTFSCLAGATTVATAQHFRMPDAVVRNPALPIGSPDAMLPRPTTSFGATTSDGWIYVIGGYTGPPHDYYMEEQQRDFYRINLHDRSHVEWLPNEHRIQSCTLEAHDGSIYRIGGMVAMNHRNEDQALDSLDAVWRFDPDHGTWSVANALPEPRSSHDSAVTGSKIVVVGGWRMDGLTGEREWHDDVLVMDMNDPDAGWKSIPAPFERRALATTTLDDDVVVIGGIGSDRSMSQSVDILDLDTGEWSTGPEYPGVAFGLAAETCNERVVASGADGTVYSWAPGESSWTEAGILTFPRFFHQIAVGSDSDLYFIGGISRGVRPTHLEKLQMGAPDPMPTVTVMSLPTPMKAKNRQGVFVHDGWLHLYGGNNSVGQHDFEADNFLSSGHRLSLADLHWEEGTEYPAARQTLQTCMDGKGNAYAIGGFGHDGEVARGWTDGYRYDMRSGTWNEDGPDLPVPRSQFGLVEHDGRMWAFGGLDYDPRREEGDHFRHLTEVVVAEAGSDFAYEGLHIPEPRRAFAGAKLDGHYYMIGGMRENFQLVDNCRSFDFSTQEFKEIPSPSRPRLSAELVALGGRLYLAGGSSPKVNGSGLESNRSIECFDPATSTWSVVMDEIPMNPRHMRMLPYRGRLLLFTSHVADEDMVTLAFIDPGHPMLSQVGQVSDGE
ncbi:MAG: kelch repeat-containing protein [Planctomycetota bacterium]|nr:kelch repeat-containing protein [Planctomycetota bacterium]